jgi:hypothetical protein
LIFPNIFDIRQLAVFKQKTLEKIRKITLAKVWKCIKRATAEFWKEMVMTLNEVVYDSTCFG